MDLPRHRYWAGLVSGLFLACVDVGGRGGDGLSQATTGVTPGGGEEGTDAEGGDGTSGAGGTSDAAEGSSDDGSPGGALPKFDVLPSGGSGGVDGCQTDPNADADGDGFSVVDGDCNDCDPNVNPGAVEVVVTEPDDMGNIPEPADEDCDGFVDNVDAPCDGGIALADTDPMNGARAIDLCQVADPNGVEWGVLSARYVRANGSSSVPCRSSTGSSTTSGPTCRPSSVPRCSCSLRGEPVYRTNPTPAARTVVPVSASGRPRRGSPRTCPTVRARRRSTTTSPSSSPSVRRPTPRAIASASASTPSSTPSGSARRSTTSSSRSSIHRPQGSIDGNISFDSNLNPVSVNIAFFEVCSGCPLGTAELQGTGFDLWNDAGATSWLETTAPVQGGETFTIRFAIWHTGDAAWDSTVLIDGFEWIADGGTVDVGTQPAG